MDLKEEIRWHSDYLKKLHKHRKNPSTYHRSLTSHPIDHRRLMHFKEQVIEAIPFHQGLIERQRKKLDTITRLLPQDKYRKLVKLSMSLAGIPEYFVYDKLHKRHFFVAEGLNPERKRWIERAKKLTEVIILEKEDK